MLECIAGCESLSEQVDGSPRYRTVKAAIACPDRLKVGLIEVVSEVHHGDGCNLINGLRIDYDDWVLMKRFGTEPKFRIYYESKDPDVAKRHFT